MWGMREREKESESMNLSGPLSRQHLGVKPLSHPPQLSRAEPLHLEPGPQESQESAVQPLGRERGGAWRGCWPQHSKFTAPPKGKPHCWTATRPGHTRHILTRSPGLSAAPWNVPRPQHRWCSMAVAGADGTPGGKWSQGLVSWHGLGHQCVVQRLLRRVAAGMNSVGSDKDNFIDRTFYCILTNKYRNLL